jgi:prolyl oligopeptidase
LVISGASNGGVLVATVANQRPDLFALVQCNVPVTDMTRYHKFTAGRSWESEYGSTARDGEVEKILKWSPLHNVKAQKYPFMWIVTGDNDDRVVPSHALKFTAEL